MSGIASKLFFVTIVVVLAACTQLEVEKSHDERAVQFETAAGSCRSVMLVASKYYNPKSFADAAQTESPAFRFIIPSSIPVTSGASGRHRITLTYSNGGGLDVRCHYRGGRTDMPDETDDEDDDPTADCDGPAGLAYQFIKCSDGSHAGDIATATSYGLHVNGGNKKAGTTTVSLGLTEQEPCGGGVDCSTQEIDDGNPCTTDACNSTDGVTHVPVAAGTSCSDNNACNGLETCSATAVCEPGTPPTIDDGNICTGDACDPILGVTHTPTPGVSCSDGNVCNGNEVCGATGTCLAGTALITDDGNACTADACDPINGVSHTPTPGVVCGGSFCAPSVCDPSAACVAGAPPNLDDGDACTIDSCDPVNNVVVHKPCSKIDPTIVTTVASATSFLYTGANPVQVGVAAGTINELRGGVLQGFVRLPDGSAAQSATVTVRNHPEYGSTTTDGQGEYIMAVNGGVTLVVDVAQSGYLPVQRQVDVPWNDYSKAADIALTAMDPNETFVDLATETDIVTARGSVVSDARGTRQATLLVPPAITATMVMPDGTTAPLDTLTLHVTEYTVGPDGPAHMPAALPKTSGYTYAAEATIEEAVASGAAHVDFDAPIPFYVENNYGFPVGSVVPVGSYDMQKGAWQAENNGLVIAITSTAGGIAQVDTTGDGISESDATLTALGMTEAERIELASLYPAGSTLWRATFTHFSIFDINSPYAPLVGTPPNDGPKAPPGDPSPEPPDPDGACPASQVGASVIDCHAQAVSEEAEVAGTPFTLHYNSLRTEGYRQLLHIPITDSAVPTAVYRIETKLEVAGRTIEQDVDCPCVGLECSCAPNQFVDLEWDDIDRFGRVVVGTQQAKVTVTYLYPRRYQVAAAEAKSFGAPGVGPLASTIVDGNPYRWDRVWPVDIGAVGKVQGLGGWTLDAVHLYDPTGHILYLGDGSRRATDVVQGVAETVAVFPFGTFDGALTVLPDGRPVTDGGFDIHIINSDGSLDILTQHNLNPQACPPLNTAVPTCVTSSTCSIPQDCWAADGAPAASVNGGGVRQLVSGPDGTLYFTGLNGRVFSITPDRRWHILTGANTGVDTGDGGPATQATFATPWGIAVGSDGAIYVSTNAGNRIRRIDAGGTVQTYAGTGVAGVSGDDGPALLATIGAPTDLAMNPQGELYFFQPGAQGEQGTRLRKIDPSGRIHLMAGGGSSVHGSPEGPAANTVLVNTSRLVATPDGGVLFFAALDFGAPGAVFQVKNGFFTRLGGGAPCTTSEFCGAGGPARAAGIVVLKDLAIGHQGEILVTSEVNTAPALLAIRPVNPLRGPNTLEIASDDGSQVYIFDANGKHLQTVDATTATVIYAMAYDANDKLVSVTDRDGLVTTIERAPNGDATAIVGPYGQSTALTIGTDGYLSRITDPASAHWDMTYTTGLMTSMTNRDGHTGTMAYDTQGRLTHDADSVGSFADLVRVDHPNGWTVTTTSALGRVRTYDRSDAITSAQSLVRTSPEGLVTTIQRDPNGVTVNTLPNGMVDTVTQTADPRFGMTAPVSTTSETTPSGITRVTQTSRIVALSDILDPLSVTSRTDTQTINGRAWTTVYNVATDVETLTSPAGRMTTQKYDPLGHLLELDVPGVLPVTFGYDDNGRLETTTQGTRVTQQTYAADGWLATVSDPLHQTTSLTRDAVGRVLTEQRPDLAITTFGYDADGNTTAVVPPGKPEHDFTFDAREQLATYDPPVLASGATDTSYLYNLDRQPLTTTQPGPREIDYAYDSFGRLSTTTFPTGVITRTYDSAGRIATLGGPTGVTLSYGYDGSLLNSMTWSGAVNGTVQRTFDTDFRISNETVNGVFPAAFGYDADSLLTSAGGLTITRDPTNGRVIATQAGSVGEVRGYDAFDAVVGTSTSASGSPLLGFSYVRDDLGRIMQKTETVGGVATVFDYEYDDAGRLINVMQNGVLTESYSYDPNGNRTFSQNSAGSFHATYDAQDRMLTYGTLTFAYTPDGELSQKNDGLDSTTTTYMYDAIGNLIEIVQPDGTDIDYIVDGAGNRIGKAVNGVFERGWLWRATAQPVAEIDASGAVVKRFVYGEGENVPELMITSGASYRLIQDSLGSVREVVDTSTNQIAESIDYDSWGRVISDTNPGFQPFGFAGGPTDADTGLVRFGWRDYSPETGQWLAPDPLPLGLDPEDLFSPRTNRYTYGAGDPIDKVDPFGLIVKLGLRRAVHRLFHYPPDPPTPCPPTKPDRVCEGILTAVGGAGGLALYFGPGYAKAAGGVALVLAIGAGSYGFCDRPAPDLTEQFDFSKSHWSAVGP